MSIKELGCGCRYVCDDETGVCVRSRICMPLPIGGTDDPEWRAEAADRLRQNRENAERIARGEAPVAIG